MLVVRENQYDRKTRKDGDLTWLSKPPIEPYAFQYRAFRHAAPEVWSALNVSIRESKTIESFKANLKTFYVEEWLNICTSEFFVCFKFLWIFICRIYL